MLAYVLYNKTLELGLEAINILKDKNLKFDIDFNIDLGRYIIYINEAEASRFSLEGENNKVFESIIIPRKRFLRTVAISVNLDGDINYGPDGSGITVGTQGLLKRMKLTISVQIMPGFIYYPFRKAFWVAGSGGGYFEIKKFKEKFESTKILERHWKVLKKLITIYGD